jgi:hypothetical protein
MAPADIDRLRNVKTLAQLMAYLRDELDWPIGSHDVEDVTFTYDPAELGFNAKATVHIKEVKQLRPLHANQPWGVFWVNFEKKRLPVVMLRRALGHLVVKKRASAGRADQKAWRMNDLLFISAYGEDHERAITFAHFSQDQGAPGELPLLKVLGWDAADTVLKLADVHRALTDKLRWPREPSDVAEWRRQWEEAFTLRHREVITTTELLVDELARLATNIRDAVLFVVSRETEKGPWRRLLTAFQATLIRNLNEESFADVIAQTISYGLLTARFSAPGTISLQNLVDLVPRTNPFLKELLEHFLSSAGRHGLFDVDEVGIDEVVNLLNRANAEAIKRDFGDKSRGEDPVIHFYEHFLDAYNKQLKVQRGVFYTPQAIVSYIVRSVHERLQAEFDLPDGLADTTTWGEMLKRHSGLRLPPLTEEPGEARTISPDEPFVQILDPATGTATFLVEVIDVIHRTLVAKWTNRRLTAADQVAAWNEYVPKHLLPRLHAFELMMAPYAIAHMKVGLKLAETGYYFGVAERARVYLTNALEPSVKQLPLIGFDALAHESSAVNEVKRHKRFTVVIGNPPYAGHSSNVGAWITHLVDDYYVVDGKPLGEKNPKWLRDDYVKFIRLGEHLISQSGGGIQSYITNHGYIGNPTFRGMREHLLGTFASLDILDLHGSTKKGEQSQTGDRDENVFDIMPGVAIMLCTKTSIVSQRALVARADLWGHRSAKIKALIDGDIKSIRWARVDPVSPFYLFSAQDVTLRNEYQRFWKTTDAMPLNVLGFQTHRDAVAVAFDAQQLKEQVTEYLGKSPTQKDWTTYARPCSYRPFDDRVAYLSTDVCDRPRPELLKHVAGRDNVTLLLPRQQATTGFRHSWVTRYPANDCVISATSREANQVFPLWLYPSEYDLAFQKGRHPNLGRSFLKAIADACCIPQLGPHGLPEGLSPEDIFNYAYAVFHSPGYRMRYAEFLKTDFPRLPLTRQLKLFYELARLGGELSALHLLESPERGQATTAFIGSRGLEVEKISWSMDTVWVDKAQTAGFTGVEEAVWKFHIGGYQVCEKWLKDRKGRTLLTSDIAHYQKIVVALTETIRLMKEIDEVIEQHGGWPGAFVTTESPQGEAMQSNLRADELVEEVKFKPRQTKVAPLPMFDQGESDESLAPGSIDNIDRSEVMAAIRDLLDGPEGAEGIDREEAIRRLAKSLGFKRTGTRIKEVLHGDLVAGARRQILETVGGRVRRLTRSITDYDREVLKDQFVASLEGAAWWERDDAIRDFARWLGFRRTGSAIEDTAKSLINGLIRTGRLEAEGTQIRKAGR